MSNAPTEYQQSGTRGFHWRRWIGAAFALTLLALFLTRRKPEPVTLAEMRPIEVLVDGYTSSESCRNCHQREYKSWYASFHRTMTQTVVPETAPEFLNNTTLTVEGQVYRFVRKGDDFWVDMDDPASVSLNDDPGRIKRRIALSTGSHHMHVFWYATELGRTLAAVPVVYLIEESRWIRRKSAFLRPPQWPEEYEIGRWNSTCLKCHTTHPRPRLRGKSHWDTHVAQFGIACEACHGPGAAHTQAMSLALGTASPQDTIVNPKKLSARRASEICGQCHSIRHAVGGLPSVAKYLEHGPRFRPGQSYEDDSYFNFTRCSPGFEDPEENDNLDMFWLDGMVRVSGREYNGLVESPCFERGELSCLSCHTMHDSQAHASTSDWTDDQLQAGMRGNRTCLQCHSQFADQVESHTHHALNSSGSLCMNCHMPHTTYGLLKAIRSHQIDSPSVAAGLQTGRIVACNQCHLDRSLEWTAGQLAKWYGQKKPDLSEELRTKAVSVLHSLKGDAGQRALAAWSFGWQPARDVSGTEWTIPFLLTLMNDEYDAVRLIAFRSLRSLPGYEQFAFDPFSKPNERARVTKRATEVWKQTRHRPHRPQLLLESDGRLRWNEFQRLLQQRDRRPVNLAE